MLLNDDCTTTNHQRSAGANISATPIREEANWRRDEHTDAAGIRSREMRFMSGSTGGLCTSFAVPHAHTEDDQY